MEAVKSYRIPVEAPKDLIEEYFKVKQKALDAIFSHVKISKKAHLNLKDEDRKSLGMNCYESGNTPNTTLIQQ
ncbi:MAG: hypothetical protein QXX99_02085 [Candidatus Bathyarchaeia archaeon]